MRTKIVILLIGLMILSSENIMSSVKIDGLYYNLNEEYKRAEVTYEDKSVAGRNYQWNTTVNIPQTVKYYNTTYQVTSIGEYAFSNCYNLSSVTIPTTVVRIGSFAFNKCSNIKSIVIPNSITRVDSCAFKECSNLTSITVNSSSLLTSNKSISSIFGPQVTNYYIGDNVTTIGKNTFSDSPNLESITLGSGIKEIALENAFNNCPRFKSFVVVSDNANFCSSNGVLFNKDTTILVRFPVGKSDAYNIPNNVISIGEYAFSFCDSLRSLRIPDNIVTLGFGMCEYCTNLSNVTFGNSITRIPKRGFRHCYSLSSFTIPNNITGIYEGAFEYCTGLTSITIPDSIKYLASSVFSGCSALTSVEWRPKNINNICSFRNLPISTFVFGDSVEIIPNYLCCQLPELRAVTIPENVTKISYESFAKCPKLTTITWNAKNVEVYNSTCFDESPIDSIYFGDKVVTIPEKACYDLSSLSIVRIPPSLLRIKKYAFNGCVGLTKVYIDDLAAWCGISIEEWAYNPLYFAHHLYLKNQELNELIIPDDVNRIENNMFRGGSFTSVAIPDHVSHIGKGAFQECSNLKYANIPKSTKTLENDIFCGCSSLIAIEIPDSVISFGEGVFSGCSSLTNINIPNSVTSIGHGAFSKCSGLTSIVIPNSVKSLGGYVLGWCEHLESVILPDSLSSLGETFNGCSSLKNVQMPHYLLSLGQAVFADCISLKSISLPKTLTYIEPHAFSNCTNLESIIIPSSVSKIEYFAFWKCLSLKSVICESSNPADIDNDTFKDVNDSLIVYIPCDAMETYQKSAWNEYTLQYMMSEFDLQVLANDTLRGVVNKESNQCESIITAIPNTGYVFQSWSDGNTENPRKIELIQDTTFTAIFAVQTFTITFVDDNDTILSRQEVEYNTMPVPPSDPIKQGDAQYSYTFAGWSPAIVVVTGDATYKATYTQTTNKYTITFLNDDNSVLCADKWEYGAMPSCEEPTKVDDEQFTYTFAGWTPEVVEVVAEASYMATYTATPKSEGVEDVQSDDVQCTIILCNGQIFILRGEKIYTVTGQEVK